LRKTSDKIKRKTGKRVFAGSKEKIAIVAKENSGPEKEINRETTGI